MQEGLIILRSFTIPKFLRARSVCGIDDTVLRIDFFAYLFFRYLLQPLLDSIASRLSVLNINMALLKAMFL